MVLTSKLVKTAAPVVGVGTVIALLVFVAQLLTLFAPVWATLAAWEQAGMLLVGTATAVATLVGGVVLFAFGPKYGIDPTAVIEAIQKILNILINGGILPTKGAKVAVKRTLAFKIATPVSGIAGIVGLGGLLYYLYPSFSGADIVTQIAAVIGAVVLALGTLIGSLVLIFFPEA